MRSHYRIPDSRASNLPDPRTSISPSGPKRPSSRLEPSGRQKSSRVTEGEWPSLCLVKGGFVTLDGAGVGVSYHSIAYPGNRTRLETFRAVGVGRVRVLGYGFGFGFGGIGLRGVGEAAAADEVV